MSLTVEERVAFPVIAIDLARHGIADAIVSRDARHRREDEEREVTPEKEPPMSPSQPGPVYENPNKDEEYHPPNVNEERDDLGYEDDDEDDDDEDDDDEDDEDEDDEDEEDDE